MPNNRNNDRNDATPPNIIIDDVPPPPYSETDVYSNSGDPRSPNPASAGHSGSNGGSDNASRVSSSSAGEVIYTPPETPRPSASPRQPATSYFFSTRPPPASAPETTIEHALDVRGGSVPDDFPFRAEFAERDVSAQDWATFVNFLIPDHAARGNEAVINRKLRAEEGSDAGRSSSGRSHAELQLEGLRGSPADELEAAQRRDEVEATVRQWNDEFFLPRGIRVRLLPAGNTERMPGSWDATFDGAPLGRNTQSGGRRRSLLENFKLDEDGIRIGDSFVMDANQMRIGSLVLDSRGIRMRVPGESSRTFDEPHRQQSYPYGQAQPSSSTMSSHEEAWDERGRLPQTSGVTRARDHSPSTLSSSSSSSSSSDSSIGSLPDYDDVREKQLPLYVARLQAWLARPDELRSKADVKQLRADLRRSVSAPTDSKHTQQTAAELRAQAKALNAQWKQLKKEQRKLRRAKKRERRQRRKSERKEEKQRRREIKKAETDLRRGRTQPPMPAEPSAPAMHPRWGPPRHSQPHGGHAFGRGFFGAQPFGHPPPGPFDPAPGPFGTWGPFRGPGFGRGCGSFGRGHRGRGGSRGACSQGHHHRSDPSRAPGAWPGDGKMGVTEDSVALPPPPGPASAALYNTVSQLESQIAHRQQTAASSGNPVVRHAAEKEIEALTASIQSIRMNADEAYARELAAHGG